MSATIPAGSRKTKISFHIGQFVQTVTDGEAFITVWDGTVGSGTQLGQAYAVKRSAGTQGMNGIGGFVVASPSAGSKTYNIGLHRGGAGGTATIAASSTNPAFVLVEFV